MRCITASDQGAAMPISSSRACQGTARSPDTRPSFQPLPHCHTERREASLPSAYPAALIFTRSSAPYARQECRVPTNERRHCVPRDKRRASFQPSTWQRHFDSDTARAQHFQDGTAPIEGDAEKSRRNPGSRSLRSFMISVSGPRTGGRSERYAAYVVLESYIATDAS